MAALQLRSSSRALRRMAPAPASERCHPEWLDSHLRINDVQVIGTHDRYKLVVSTDDPQADPRLGDCHVEFPGQRYRRCNPSRPACERSPSESKP